MPVTWVINENLVTRSVGDEMIVLNLESGTFHSLNSVGAALYRSMRHGASVEALVEAVVGEFEVDAEQARLDIEAFLATEASAGLVERVSAT